MSIYDNPGNIILKEMADFKHIISRFGLNADGATVSPFGNGLINSTSLVTLTDGSQYVMQRINDSVFKNIEQLHHNIDTVTRHISAALKKQGIEHPERKCLNFLCDKSTGKTYTATDSGYYRLTQYIPDSVTHESVTPELAEAAGRAFGEFEGMLADIADRLYDTIPDFHNMEFRLSQLNDAVAADTTGRYDGVKELIGQILSFADEACIPEQLYRDGKLPMRVCHCDTKVNNVLFDKNGNILCVIDLDTVMPSLILSDYGDFLRTAANTAPEDEPDTDRIYINHEVYNAFTRGYLSAADSFLTPLEKQLLPQAMLRFAYMQAVRFMTDYLNGDTYFKTAYADHNLVRAKAQWRLACLAKDLG